MKLVNKPSFVIVVFLVLSITAISAQNKPSTPNQFTKPLKTDAKSKELIAQLEKTIPQLMKDGEVPGLSIAVISNAKVVWQQSFGVANTATNQAVNDNTIFEAARRRIFLSENHGFTWNNMIGKNKLRVFLRVFSWLISYFR